MKQKLLVKHYLAGDNASQPTSVIARTTHLSSGGRDVSRIDTWMLPLKVNVNELFSPFLHSHWREIIRAGAVIFHPGMEVSVEVDVGGLLLALVCLPLDYMCDTDKFLSSSHI